MVNFPDVRWCMGRQNVGQSARRMCRAGRGQKLECGRCRNAGSVRYCLPSGRLVPFSRHVVPSARPPHLVCDVCPNLLVLQAQQHAGTNFRSLLHNKATLRKSYTSRHQRTNGSFVPVQKLLFSPKPNIIAGFSFKKRKDVGCA